MLEINERTASAIESRYYFNPIKKSFEEKIREVGEIRVLDSLTEVMRNAQPEVEKIIQRRKADGYIESIDQARRSVSGKAFQCLIAYSLIRLQEAGKLNSGLVILPKPKKHALAEEYAIRMAGGEVQIPDIDILVYMYTKPEKHAVIIYSTKTSLRKSSIQTYIWKLLMDVVDSENCKAIKGKYELFHEVTANLNIGLIATDLYDETMNVQQQNILKCFDFAYIIKSGEQKDPISHFSSIVNDLNAIYQ